LCSRVDTLKTSPFTFQKLTVVSIGLEIALCEEHNPRQERCLNHAHAVSTGTRAGAATQQFSLDQRRPTAES
jgi:hypothetical protein